MPQLTHGILIAIEGIDGSGKTTLAKNISARFQQRGFDTLLTREPGDSELGKEIRQLVQAQNILIAPVAQYLLFAADRAQHFTERIIPALNTNHLIICDRLSDSSLAYQGYGNGIDRQMISSINQWTMQKIQPHLTIYVRISLEKALERCQKRGSLSAYEKKEFLERVAQGFEEIYQNRDDVIIVSGDGSPEKLEKMVSTIILEWLQSNKYLAN
jgi:dTMP kinase